MGTLKHLFDLSGKTALITGGSPEQFRDILKSELAKFGKLVKQAGIKGDGA